MRKYFLLLLVCIFFSFGDTSLKKRTSDAQYRYEFYTTTKVVSVKAGRNYFWFKGGKIHNSEYGMAGELLHDAFAKFYHSNQLAEAGTFKNGLKNGYWKTWYDNGTLQTETYYNDGRKSGKYLAYDKTGVLTEVGSYKKNLKHGRWINYTTKDTLKYRNGKVVLKKIKPAKVKDTLGGKQNKPGFFKRIFIKKDGQNNAADSSAVKTGKAKVKQAKTDKPKAAKAVKDKEEDKPGFFKRLFTPKK